MAHEINNPLAGIMQTAAVMASRSGDNIHNPANRKAAEAGGVDHPRFTIRTSFEEKRYMVCMEIEDNGPAMDEAIHALEKGFYVKNGKIVHPVSEMNIAGNHLELWNQLSEVGNDPWRYSTMRVPTLCFTDMSCSGSEG